MDVDRERGKGGHRVVRHGSAFRPVPQARGQKHKRLFHPRARPKAELVRAAASALGERVVVELEDAA